MPPDRRWQVVASRKRELGPTHGDTLHAMCSLAALLEDMGTPAEAKPIYEAVVAAQQGKLGASHRDTLRTQSSLADLLVKLGKVAKGEAMLRKVVEGQVRRRLSLAQCGARNSATSAACATPPVSCRRWC